MITRVGRATANANTITIPDHQAGDFILISASRASNTAASLGSGFTNIQAAGANTLSLRTGYLIATGSSHTSGTWTNAARLICVVYRPLNGGTLSLGASVSSNGSSSTLQNYPALTLAAPNGKSAVIYSITRSNTSGVATAPTNWTTVGGINTAPVVRAHERFGVTSHPTSQDVTGLTSGAWRTHGIEIRFTGPPVCVAHTES
jgi:hypothetical protein